VLAVENLAQAKALEHYAHKHTQPEPKFMKNLVHESKVCTTGGSMLTGRIEGRLLKLLITLCRAKHVLEVGTFTGYSALSMAEALPNNGTILTCEVNPDAARIALKYFRQSPHGHKITIANGIALNTIQTTNVIWDFAFVDADKQNYDNYYEAILPKIRSGGLIVIDNALWGGEVLAPVSVQAKVIAGLNHKIRFDSRVENVLLPVRDGINIVRKK